jgi:hypothetical protein
MAVTLLYRAPVDEPGVIYENIIIMNPTDNEIDTFDFKCGFARQITDHGERVKGIENFRFCPIPYRSGTDGKLMDHPLTEATKRGMMYQAWMEPPVSTAVWGSEGWVFSDGSNSLLISKFNDQAMEWSLMEGSETGSRSLLRFAGAGRWRHGHPEGAARLAPHASFKFGETRLQIVDGGWRHAYYAYRSYMEGKGCMLRAGYDPPVHWNELYDNKYWFILWKRFRSLDWDSLNEWIEATQEILRKKYTLKNMLLEAEKARDLGCQTLYLDPGWETVQNHHVWAGERLGSVDIFVRRMKEEYNLNVGVWINIAGVPPTYGDPAACPPEAAVVDENGNRTKIHCFPSPAFMKTKMDRMDELCRGGIRFFLVDATQFTGPCYDKTHGHDFPSRREEHAEAIYQIISHVKRQFPDLLVEVHDRITGPCGINYTPFYFQYARPDSFDCIWGHEFMWDSMKDLLERRAISLYYYNLASSIPFYLHIGLKSDNENCLAFWWFASTIRHLGVGGKHKDAKNWQAHKEAMRTYLENKRFFTQGKFYGLDETFHAHTLPDIGESVINVFNLDKNPVERTYHFQASDIGLTGYELEIDSKPAEKCGDQITVKAAIPALGHRLIKIKGSFRT